MSRFWQYFTYALSIGVLAGLICALTPSRVAACESHEVVDRWELDEKGQLRPICVAKCAPSEQYLTVAIDNDNHCVKKSSTNFQDNPIFSWLTAVLRFLSYGIGLTVVAGIVWGGLLYITGRDKAEQTAKAVSTILNSLLGLLLFILLFAIVNFLLPGGLLT